MYDFSDELRIPYKVDRTRDYMDEFNAEVPAWFPATFERYTNNPNLVSVALGDQPAHTPRTLEDRKRKKTYTIAHQKYVRGVDQNGHLHPVSVSTARPGPGSEDGDDRIGTYHRVKGEKQFENGWLWIEEGDSFQGRSGDDYYAWVCAVREARRAKYEASQATDAQTRQDQALTLLLREQGKINSDANSQLLKQVVEMYAKLAAGEKEKKSAKDEK